MTGLVFALHKEPISAYITMSNGSPLFAHERDAVILMKRGKGARSYFSLLFHSCIHCRHAGVCKPSQPM